MRHGAPHVANDEHVGRLGRRQRERACARDARRRHTLERGEKQRLERVSQSFARDIHLVHRGRDARVQRGEEGARLRRGRGALALAAAARVERGAEARARIEARDVVRLERRRERDGARRERGDDPARAQHAAPRAARRRAALRRNGRQRRRQRPRDGAQLESRQRGRCDGDATDRRARELRSLRRRLILYLLLLHGGRR